MKPVTFRPNRNLVFILVALALGVVAAVVAVNYVQKAVDARTQDEGETIVVAVPKQDMEAGMLVGSDDLAARPVPVDLVPADAITPDNYGDYVGRILRAPVRQGAPVPGAALVPLYDQFSSVIKAGNVGYTMSVDETNSISGMIAPGDHVDILLTVDQEQGGARVLPLLENVNVLATGNRVGETPADEDAQGFSNITLELSPREAERLTVAGKAGSLRVILRQNEDRSEFGLNGLTQKQLLGTGGNEGGGQSGGVHFIIGGKG
ncbi:Flp pilus assembly protein CpaB [Xanthomonas sp. H13-6]|uniref:Flp pilus assembly protein CpaB n=1 Tax=Xanthomonas chitinilytica TaxID=2989819 RepID=A0ABT3JXX1_9XANT|nr:Flp pilus assembly protein CpaB [Xanthomonas sp. H13-6]MCW4473332.1 Flp pilus assembly protein CpaB [Xanthomonas sp. H13-6]